MKKIIPLIFSVLYVLSSNAQAVGGWGTCEFADVATMNAFDPSTNAYDCKKVFVQATNEHYYWNGTIWVLVANTDDQNASEVPFTPVGTIVATDVQAAIAEIEPDIYGSIDVHSDVDISTTPPTSGDLLSWDGSNFVPTSTDNGYTVFNIFAEESSSLNASGGTEWAFGNGDNTPSGHGIVIPVDCELFAMSLDHEGGVNTTVRIIKNTDATLSTYQVVTSGSENGYNTFGTPLSFSAGDIANFRTISASSTGNSGRVSAWFRIRATPASTSLVNDMLDVSAGSIASGDILYFDGSSFVPLTLEASNIPYDNATSGLTATNTQAAIDELASGGSADNIYNTDGTVDANREVTLGNFDIEFNSTGTGDFFVSDNGTIVFAVEDDHVGIGLASPTKPLHIFETTGTPASATNGTIFLEKGDSGGSQSIVFESNVNAGSDYGYIEYSDDGSGNGSTTENSLLVIGTENDGVNIYQDDIAIMPSGYLGVGTTSPDAFFDVDGGSVRFSDYGGGTITGTVSQILGVDVNGDVIEVDPSTLGGSSSSAAIGTIYIANGDEAITTLTEDIPTKASGATTLVNATDVDMPTNNRLRYTGSDTQTFLVTCNISTQTESNNRQVYYSIRKDGAIIPSILAAEHHSSTNSSDELNSTTITGTVELSNNEYIELWIENVENDEDVTVWFMNLSMVSISGSSGGGGGGSADNLGNHTAEENIQMTDYWISNDGDNEGIFVNSTGNVGIGTGTPNALLDVEGGSVRFSDYGVGTYEDTTAVYLLGVEADGDIIEMNTAKNSRIFYPPAIAIIADVIGTNLTLDLHQTYLDLFQSPAISSTSAPGAVPTYNQDELYYYILDYDTDVFENITIDDNGLMEYDIKEVASDNCSFINVVFVIKEP